LHAIFFCAAVASADPVEQGLPETAGEQVKNSTNQMLNQGFNTENVIDMTRAHTEDLAMQTFMTTQMMTRLGMQSKSVGDSVCQALQQGYSAQEMNRMRNTIMANARGQNSDFGQHGGQSAMGGMGDHGGDSGDGMGGGSGGGGMDGGHM
jgi:uncharacterized membrane protein YgcG